jgi:hypothetical protein
VGPGLEYILKGLENLWIKSISEVIILWRYMRVPKLLKSMKLLHIPNGYMQLIAY